MGDWASLAMLPALGEPFLFYKKEKPREKKKPVRSKKAGDLSQPFLFKKKMLMKRKIGCRYSNLRSPIYFFCKENVYSFFNMVYPIFTWKVPALAQR